MNVAKYTRSSVGHMFAHFERKDGVKFKNQDIDITRSHLNYNLHNDNRNQFEILNSILNDENIKVSKRKDLNVMCSWVITAPIEIQGDENKEKIFFEETYNFFSEKFGKQNVISAYVHMDETSPHMHFAFVPVFYDKNKELYKINAKSIINKNLLNSIHPVFQNHLNAKLGRNFAKIHRHNTTINKSIKELKQETAELNLQILEYKQKIQELEQKFNEKIQENIDIPKYQYQTKTFLFKGDYVSLDDVEKIVENQDKRKELIINSNKKIKVLEEKLNLKDDKINILEKENQELKTLLTNNKREKQKIELVDLKLEIKEKDKKIKSLESNLKSKTNQVIDLTWEKDVNKNYVENLENFIYDSIVDEHIECYEDIENNNFLKENKELINKAINNVFDRIIYYNQDDTNLEIRNKILNDYKNLNNKGVEIDNSNKNKLVEFNEKTQNLIQKQIRYLRKSRGLSL